MIDDKTPIDPYPRKDFRDRIVAIAESEIGEPESYRYAAGALGMTETEAQARGTDKLAWCGLFATWVLQQAGARVNWVLGKGICFNLNRTTIPQPGDILYINKPYQHHAIVESVGNEMVTSIDGNSTGNIVARRTRPLSEISAFYDVEVLNPDRMMT